MLRDLLGASRDLGHERLRDTGDLITGLGRMPSSPAPPSQARGPRSRCRRGPLGGARERRRRLEDGLGVKGPPLAVRHRPRSIPNDEMVVQLRVVSSAREVGEGGGDDPGHVLFDDAAGTRAGVEDVALGVGKDVVDRLR